MTDRINIPLRMKTTPPQQLGSLGLAIQAKLERDAPKCRYCDRPVMVVKGQPDTLCELHLDVEFCCNVSKDLYGTKSLALHVARDYGLDEAAAYFESEQDRV